MAGVIDHIRETLYPKILSDESLKYQVDGIVLINIACVILVTSYFHDKGDYTSDKNIDDIKTLFIVYLSFFASALMILAWYSSKNLSAKFVRYSYFTRPELDLIWACWAIVFWQAANIYKLHFETGWILHVFSSFNNMFFIWAASDFVINNKWKWQNYQIFKIFQVRETVFFITLGFIALTFIFTLIIGKGTTAPGQISLISIPDFLYSLLCVIILMIGFYCIFSERYLAELNSGRGPLILSMLIKYKIIYIILLSPFLFAIFRMVNVTFPSLIHSFLSLLKFIPTNLMDTIDLYYKSAILLLFLTLELSWVRQKVEEKNNEIKEKDIELINKEHTLNEKNKDIEFKKGKITKNLNDIQNLKNEISHRFKNHLEALSLEFDRQIQRYTDHPNGEIVSILTSVRGRIEATLLVHSHLDNKKVEEVNLGQYLQELCEKLKNLFNFQDGRFIYHINDNLLNYDIAFGDARGIGIAITEIIINIDQHAYTSHEEKYLLINVHIDDKLTITIEDHGQGFKPKQNKDDTKGKGIPFVISMIKGQLMGSVKFIDRTDNANKNAQKGVLTIITIPVNNLSIKQTHSK